MPLRLAVRAGLGATLIVGGVFAAHRSSPARVLAQAQGQAQIQVQAVPPAVSASGHAGLAPAPPPPLSLVAPASPRASATPAMASADEARAVEGLDLARIAFDGDTATARSASRTAELTVDADLQRTATRLMSARHVPEAAVVLMEVETGRVLVYASHVEHGPPRDLCAAATAPSASVFKIVTAATLLEDAHLEPDTSQCYQGGEQRIEPADLVPDPRRDRWCATLASALGRSINTVFARLASERLTPDALEAMARRFGYGAPLPFDVPVQPSELHIPREPLEFARTAAGFWNTTLSPLEAAEMSAIVAGGGRFVRPSIVARVTGPSGAVAASSPAEPASPRRAIAVDTAEKLAAMMGRTVSEGTSLRAFRDERGAPYLRGLGAAGKTGTLTDAEAQRFYTWFTGFAPTRAVQGIPQVAVAALVVNGPTWRIKANVLARDVLRAYFAARGVPGVTRPGVAALARQRRPGRRSH
ncbi:MAG: penicillin-binding protein [Myxococcales bacterium]|nr:penicillin-binding protein [Myxococcales bacterium]